MSTAYRTPLALRRVLALAAGLLALVLALQGALTLLDLLAREETTTVRELGQVRRLDVDSDGGAIVVRAAAGPAQVRSELVRGLWGGSAAVTVADAGQVRVRTDCPEIASVSCSARHVVTVPPGIPVTVRTDSGSVTLDAQVGQASFGPVDVRTGSGAVSVADAGGATLAVQTGSGEIAAEAIGAETVRLRTGSGAIAVAADAAPRTLTARTGSGDVALAVPDVPYAVSTETGSGALDVRVRSDDAAERSLTVETGSGSISVRPSP